MITAPCRKQPATTHSTNQVRQMVQACPYHTEHQRLFFSVFGELAFWRPYFYRQDVGGASPLE